MRPLVFLGTLVSIIFLAVGTQANAAELRTWTSAGGGFSIKGSYVRVENKPNGVQVVVIEKQNGKQIPVPLSKLSEADQAYVEQLLRPTAPPRPVARPQPEKPPRPAAPAQPPEKKKSPVEAELSDRGLSKEDDTWVVEDEGLLEGLWSEVQVSQEAYDREVSSIDKKARKSADALRLVLARRTQDNADLNSVYSTSASLYSAEIRLKNDRNREFRNFSRDANKRLQNIEDPIRAIAKAKQALIKALREVDQNISGIQMTYNSLAGDPKVVAALDKVGDRLGPGPKFWQVAGDCDKSFGKYAPLSEQMSRGVEAFFCRPLLSGNNKAASPEEFLESLGLRHRGVSWILVCEEQVLDDGKVAEKTGSQRLRLLKSSTRAKRAEANKAVSSAQRKAQGIKNELLGRGYTSSKMAKLRVLLLERMAVQRRAEEKLKSFDQATKKADDLEGEQRVLIDRIIKNSAKIIEHYEKLIANPDVKKAVEQAGGTLSASSNLGQQVRKAKGIQKKLGPR